MRMDECVVDTKDQEAKQLRVRFCPKLGGKLLPKKEIEM